MASGADLIRKIKEQITEVDPREVHSHLHNGNGNGASPVIVDVREQHEFEEAHLPGAIHVPRGHLESRIEGKVGDKSRPVVLYCASGQRSALAANTLQDLLGYEDVASMTGGITLWKDRGYEVETPRVLTPEQKSRYSRHLLLPEVGIEGQQKLLDAKVLLLGAGGLGSPTGLYLAAARGGPLGLVDDRGVDVPNPPPPGLPPRAAAGVGTPGIAADDGVDASTPQRQVTPAEETLGQPKVDSAAKAINKPTPDVKVEKYETRLDSSNIMEIIQGYDVIVDGVD